MALDTNKVEQMPINLMDILTTFQIGKRYHFKQNLMEKPNRTKLMQLVFNIYSETIPCIIVYCKWLIKVFISNQLYT